MILKVGLNTLEDIVRMTAQAAANDGDLLPLIGDDFPARGKAYRDLSADERAEVRSGTVERHFTLNWLCGLRSVEPMGCHADGDRMARVMPARR